MVQRLHVSVALLACAVLALATPDANADGKKKDKDRPRLSGTWARQEGEMKIEFSDKDVMKIVPHGEKKVIVVVCEYAVDKQGLVKAKIKELEGEAKDKAKDHLPVGLEFSFKWQVKDDAATLDDVKGDNVDPLKAHLEGKYEKK